MSATRAPQRAVASSCTHRSPTRRRPTPRSSRRVPRRSLARSCWPRAGVWSRWGRKPTLGRLVSARLTPTWTSSAATSAAYRPTISPVPPQPPCVQTHASSLPSAQPLPSPGADAGSSTLDTASRRGGERSAAIANGRTPALGGLLAATLPNLKRWHRPQQRRRQPLRRRLCPRQALRPRVP